MFYSTYILVYIHPVIATFFIENLIFPHRFIGSVTHKIPTRLKKGIHSISFTNCLTFTCRTSCVFPSRVSIKRVSLSTYLDIFRKCDWKIFYGFRNQSTFFTMNHRDRSTPITLATDSPIS